MMTTMLVVLVPTTTHIPSFITVAHTEFWIFAFYVISQSQQIYANEVLNMCIRWGHTMWVVLLPTTTHIPSNITVAHTELWMFAFAVISQSEQICKWGITYTYLVMTTMLVVLVPAITHIPSFIIEPIQNSGYLPFMLLANQNRYM